ncbi:MAG TPA: glycosyltransferase family 2 protein [Microthrixaceae bacterium]|nr:glycosyltransferase family 2 protein [Microthrixaceae bacterium]
MTATSPTVPLRVVIIHWNQAESCVDTVARFLSDRLPINVTVVDNGSDSDQLEILRKGLHAQADADFATDADQSSASEPIDPSDAKGPSDPSGANPGANDVGGSRSQSDPSGTSGPADTGGDGRDADGSRSQSDPSGTSVLTDANGGGIRTTTETVTTYGSAVTLVETGKNLGFGPGANVGLRRFLADANDGEWVVVAPHDVSPAPDCLGGMLKAADPEPMAGLMCADVGDGMTPVIDPYFGGMVVPAAQPISVGPMWEEVDYPHGTLMMLRRECLDEAGVFDERFFSYCEEADLGIRVRKAGWRIGLIRGARVTNMHIGSGVKVVDYLQTRNTLLLVQENSGWYHAFIRACITLEQVIRGTVWPASRPLIFDAKARLKGLRDFVLRRFGPPPASL